MINWNELEKQFITLKTLLGDLLREKNNFSQQFPFLLKQRKQAKLEYKKALKEATAVKNQIHLIANRLKRHKEEWLSLGKQFTIENLFLNIEASKDIIAYEKLKEIKKAVIFDIPKQREVQYNKKSRQCNKIASQIKALKSQALDTQKRLSELEVVWELNDYEILDGTHKYDEYCQISRYQLSIKKQKKYVTHSFYYCRVDGEWYILSGGEKDKMCDRDEKEFIENLINESHSNKSRI